MAASSRPDPGCSGAPPLAAEGTGRLLVAAMLLGALGLAVFAIWFQWQQTRRCLDFFGPETAARIQSAVRVELWELDGRTIEPRRRLDVSTARGLVHLRRGLVEDGNFVWQSALGSTAKAVTIRPFSGWDAALAFFDSPSASQPGSVLLVEWGAAAEQERGSERSGRLGIAGRPGVVDLGRIEKGLRAWIDATWAAARGNRAFGPR